MKLDYDLVISSDCQSVLHTSLYELRQNSSLCDVTIVDESGSALMAHACILAAASPTLNKMLLLDQTTSIIRKQGLTINITGISLAVWDILLQYFYMGKTTVAANAIDLNGLHVAAQMLQLNELQSVLSSYITQLGRNVDSRKVLDKFAASLFPSSDASHCDQGVQVDMYGTAPLNVITSLKVKKKRKMIKTEPQSQDENAGEGMNDDDNYEDSHGEDTKPNRTLHQQMICPKPDCLMKFTNPTEHRDYLEHIVKCLMSDGCQLPIHFSREEENKVFYEDGLDIEGVDNSQLFATPIETKRKALIKQYQCNLCRKSGSLVSDRSLH